MMTVAELAISRKYLFDLLDEARHVLPAEACAILIGRYNGSTAKVEEIVITPNTRSSSVVFTIDPEILLKVYTDAEEKEMDVVGIFHSHPAPPKPSGIDVDFMKVNPVVWLIASNTNWSIAAFQWREDKISEVKVTQE